MGAGAFGLRGGADRRRDWDRGGVFRAGDGLVVAGREPRVRRPVDYPTPKSRGACTSAVRRRPITSAASWPSWGCGTGPRLPPARPARPVHRTRGRIAGP